MANKKANVEQNEMKLEVIKPNSIAEARGKKSKCFLDMLDISLQQAAKDNNPENLRYTIDIKKYKNKFGLKFEENSFKKLRQSIKAALKEDTLMTIKDASGRDIEFFVFQELIFDPQKLTIEIMFTERFKQIMVDLLKEKGKKIYYSLPDTLQMNGVYSKKLYPILLEHVNRRSSDRMVFNGKGSLSGQRFDSIFPIDYFKELIGIPISYKMSNIKETCTLIIDEIETFTPYHAEVFFNEAPVLRGRPKTTHICFRMAEKQENSKSSAKDIIKSNDDIVVIEYVEDECVSAVEAAVKAAKLDLTVTNIVSIANAAKKHKRSAEEIKERIGYIGKHSEKIESIVAYSIWAMSDEFELSSTKGRRRTRWSDINRDDKTDYDAIAKAKVMETLNKE